MMTVKHITDSGETVLPCRSVEYLPHAATLKVMADDKQNMLTGGKAFVMNDSGATVARYDLSQRRAGR